MTNTPKTKELDELKSMIKSEVLYRYDNLKNALDSVKVIDNAIDRFLTAYRQSVLDESANAAYESGCSARTLNAINHLKQL